MHRDSQMLDKMQKSSLAILSRPNVMFKNVYPFPCNKEETNAFDERRKKARQTLSYNNHPL